MSRKDIVFISLIIILSCVCIFNYLCFVEDGQKFQKTIDSQRELLYNKDMQIEEMTKVISGQEKRLIEVYNELEEYKQKQSNIMDIRVTHYSADETGSTMTASGREAEVGRTVACNFLPIGAHVLINGNEYIVEDTGLMPDNVVDIFVNDVHEANRLGTYYTTMEVL